MLSPASPFGLSLLHYWHFSMRQAGTIGALNEAFTRVLRRAGEVARTMLKPSPAPFIAMHTTAGFISQNIFDLLLQLRFTHSLRYYRAADNIRQKGYQSYFRIGHLHFTQALRSRHSFRFPRFRRVGYLLGVDAYYIILFSLDFRYHRDNIPDSLILAILDYIFALPIFHFSADSPSELFAFSHMQRPASVYFHKSSLCLSLLYGWAFK